MVKKIVIIGGSAAGPKAAARARRLDQNAEITIIQKDMDLSMASCGFPYYVGGFFDDRNQLISTPTGVVRNPKFFMAAKQITAKIGTEVISINNKEHTIICKKLSDGSEETVEYDKLIITTGANPRIPKVPGTDLEGVTTLQSMKDADYLRGIRDEKKIKKAVVVGGGLIGIETCEALSLAGFEITLVEIAPQILMFLDPQFAKIVENHVKTHALDLIMNNGVSEFTGENGKLTGVKLQDGKEISCELAVIAVGVIPNSTLAEATGLKIGKTGGIAVDEYMCTSDPDIYAAGDCVEVPFRVTGEMVHAPYGDLANLEGRVAGENVISGNKAVFPGTMRTGICKVFDFTAASTGLSETAARDAGFTDIETAVTAAPDKPGFMTAKPIMMKMVADKKSGKLLGVQCIGPGDVSKRIAGAAMALHGSLKVSDLVTADLPYAPPFSPAIDNFITLSHVVENKINGLMKGISAVEVKKKIDAGEKPFLLDARGPDEFEAMRLGIGEVLIPLGQLRQKMDQVPADKDAEIICYCKISLRGYEAALILAAAGYTNVKVMEGGIICWPFKLPNCF